MRSLAIVGHGNGWLEVKSETVREIWAVSSVFKSFKQADRYFDIHVPTVHRELLKNVNATFSDTFPYGELITEFGRVFHSSVSWLLGYAYISGYTDIRLYGINMEHGTEYGSQRDSFFYMYGNLAARGVKIEIPEGSGVSLSKKLYGV